VTTDPVEAALLASARRGSHAAFASIVRRRQAEVRGFLRRLCESSADAEDLAQETFLAAWIGLAGYKGDGSLRAWLCGVAYRKAMDRRRADRRRRLRDEAVGSLASPLIDPRAGSGRRGDVWRALTTLPADQRAAVALCLGSDFSHGEAAQALNLPLGTVKSHVARGRAALAQALEAYDATR
jgi:RNA polymerase sigma-70 factor (ECF subfamily)